jgi:hypothetical protein
VSSKLLLLSQEEATTKPTTRDPTTDFLFLSYTIKSQIQASNQMRHHHHPQQQQQIHERHRHHSWIPTTTTTTTRWSIPEKKKKKKPTNSDTLHDNSRKQPGNLWLP